MRDTAKPLADYHRSIIEDADTRRLLNIFIAVVLGGSLLYVVALPLAVTDAVLRGVGILAADLCAILALLLLRRGQTAAAVSLLIWGVWASVLIQMGITNGLMSRSVMAIPILVVMAGWLLDKRAAILFCVATAFAGIAIAVLEWAGVVPLMTSPSPPLTAGLAFAIYVVLAASVAYSIFRGFRRRHEALAARERELNLLMESVPSMIFHGDCEGRCLYANRAYADFYASSENRPLGRTVREIIGEEAYAGIRDRINRVLTGEAQRYRGDRKSARGEWRTLDIQLLPELDEAGGVRGFFALINDVTERVRAEDELIRSEQKFSTAFHCSPVATVLTRLEDGRYVDVNEAFVRLLGWRRDEALGRTSSDLGVWMSPQARAEWAAALLREGRLTNVEMEFRARSGDVRTVLLSSELIEVGGESCALVMASDMTERKRAEEKFTKVFQACPVPISISRLEDGRYIDINDAFIEQFGWRRDEFLGHTSVEIGLWPSAEERLRWIAELSVRGRVRSYESQLLTKAGEPRTVLISAERITLDNESCLIGLVHDITERLQAEAALRASELRLREAQRIGHIGSWEMDLISQRMIWSEEIFDIFGIDPGTFGGNYAAFLETVYPADRAIVEAYHQESVSADTPYEMEHRIVTPQGQVRRVHERWRVFRGGGGKPPRAIGTLQDVTEAARAREEIRRLNDQLEKRVQERTAELTAANRELESFAYSISHDLRAPLRSIDGFTHLLAEEYGPKFDQRGHDFLERVRRAAQRMGGLIDDILELSRVTRQEMRRVTVNLSELATELLDERARADAKRVVQLRIAPDCMALGDPQLLRVLMQNLLENAWKYSARNSEAQIEFGCETTAGETAFFVRDNGVGFDMNYAARLFVPFQRLHSPEEFEGTGIGLATVARIVHRHGGRVWAEAAPGQGATFRFTLP